MSAQYIPLIPHFYIVKLRYAGVYLFFLFLLQNIDCGYSFSCKFSIFKAQKISVFCFASFCNESSVSVVHYFVEI